MINHYVLTTKEFWDQLPHYQQLTCGRIRLAKEQFVHEGDQYFGLKGEALSKFFKSPNQGLWVIHETEYSEDRWIYEIVIGQLATGDDAD